MSIEETTAQAPSERQASLVPTALIGLAFLAGAIAFLASASSWYVTFMTVHVLFVVLWVGGGLFLTLFAILAERSNDSAQITSITKMAAFAGERVFAPAAIVVLAMGISMVLNAHLGFGHFWIIFGLLGFASTFIIGIGVLGPRAKKLEVLLADKGADHPDTQAAISQILLIARFDIAVLALVVVDMVTKPFS
jgi:uncharacterized membrane protein